MLQGITAGFILSLALFPGSIWLIKVGYNGRAAQCITLGVAFGLSQFIWLIVAVPGLMMMIKYLGFAYFAMHLFAAFVLAFMSYKFFRSRRAETLTDSSEIPVIPILFRNALSRSLAMPMRLPAAVAVLLATGAFVDHSVSMTTVYSVLIGALIGVFWWWGQLTFLAVFFVKRIPEAITLKSINKARPFCGVVFICLAIMALFFSA
ncbi:MAG: hypothetical protein AAF546_01435 [Verrucomicrobiota bacterium]